MTMQVAALDILTTQGGFAPATARSIVEAMIIQIKHSYENLATSLQLSELRAATKEQIDELRAAAKEQILELRADTKQQIDELRREFHELRHELRQELVALERRLEARIDTKIAEAKAEILRWMFVAMTGQTVVLIGLMRWLLPHGP